MLQLLVSVADAAEARAALQGGADVIDAKDPRRGALGPVRPAALVAIRAAVGRARPVSAALGDARTERLVARAARAAAARGAAFVKIGFAGLTSARRARRLAAAAREAAGAHTGVVLVAYADFEAAASLAPEALVAVAAETAVAGVLLDTACKRAPLFSLTRPEVVGVWIAQAHAGGLRVGLAGSLGGPDFATACALAADLVGVRGAACVGGRHGRVALGRVAALRAA
ncbi:MAG TPA: (5-formylfuran-3-yl)methyl phosphate synthase, partial [Gemmatimonadales bacterium]|nr:(5-formylfuran-3-yl)methyl phosphate synthase [Gemmatimonadales bacterium]